MATVATLQRITAKTLAEMILAEADSPDTSYAIIDVRDDDHIGGRIKNSRHIPSLTLDTHLPTLPATLASKRVVVFHCALSQVRGPSAALRYLRYLHAREEEESEKAGPQNQEQGQEQEQQKQKQKQKVYVLDQGFVGWAGEFGSDERLTVGFRKELWDGY